MAVINYASEGGSSVNTRLVSWSALTDGDTGQPFDALDYADRTVQVNAPGGGTVVIEGSLDGTNYFTLRSIRNTDLSFAAAGLEAIAEHVRYLRPGKTGGTASSVYLMITR